MSAVLITGADGHLGRAVARRLLAQGAPRLVLWVRASDAQAGRRKRKLLGDLLRDRRCRLAFGDLADPDPFAQVEPAEIGAIVHAAAVTAFSVPEEMARVSNVEGTRKMLEFARRCRILSACLLMSSLYAAGLVNGEIAETPFARPPGFANHYEWSKWAAEQLLQDEFADVPWRVVRLGTLLAEDDSGAVVQRNAFHNTLQLFFYGLLSVMPGRPSTRVYLTTTEFAAAACARLLNEGPMHGFFHASEAWDDALDLCGVIDQVHACFMADEGFRRLGIRKPLFCELDGFRALARGALQFGSVALQSLSSLTPFAPQLYSDKRVANSRLRATLPDLAVPLGSAILPRVCERWVADRWSKSIVREAAE